MMKSILTESGNFVLGCNYWASHAGTHMWRDWQPDVVKHDLEALSKGGVEVMRVFPLWPDFQPIHLLTTAGGRPMEVRHGEEPLPDTEWGRAGLEAGVMERFGAFLDLAAEHDVKLIIGLLTGWMSGRLHVPPALQGRNVLTDPFALRWQLRFVKTFVKTFREHQAIVGWDLGNECNCMGVVDQDQAYAWAASIADAIRSADPDKPVVSGMHSLKPAGAWTMQDQGELTDLLTTHPYPVFTPHCDQDPVNTMRTILHSTAESRFYADIGGTPCLCQEIGALGPCNASDAVAADFARACLFSLWANDCHGFLWWCANDQNQLAHAPYDWQMPERELGLLRDDGSAKPALAEFKRFRELLEQLPFDRLPPRQREAVCIISRGQDHWGVAYSTFVLAKQAGVDLEFRYADQPLPDAALYLLPSVCGNEIMSRRTWHDLLARVEAGATLYMSINDALVSEFEPVTGLEPQTRERRTNMATVKLLEGGELDCQAGFRINFKATQARVLASESDGNPAFVRNDYGNGHVYFLSVPMELHMANTPGAFHAETARPAWHIYRSVLADLELDRVVSWNQPDVCITEHGLAADRRVAVLVNTAPQALTETIAWRDDWELVESYGSQVTADGECRLGANDGCVVILRRSDS